MEAAEPSLSRHTAELALRLAGTDVVDTAESVVFCLAGVAVATALPPEQVVSSALEVPSLARLPPATSAAAALALREVLPYADVAAVFARNPILLSTPPAELRAAGQRAREVLSFLPPCLQDVVCEHDPSVLSNTCTSDVLGPDEQGRKREAHLRTAWDDMRDLADEDLLQVKHADAKTRQWFLNLFPLFCSCVQGKDLEGCYALYRVRALEGACRLSADGEAEVRASCAS